MCDRYKQRIYGQLKALFTHAQNGERVVFFCENASSRKHAMSMLLDILRVRGIFYNNENQKRDGGVFLPGGCVRLMTCDARRFHLDVGEKLATHRFHRYDVEPNIQEVFEADLLERARCFDAKLGKVK